MKAELAVLFGAVATVAGCSSPPSCEKVARHVGELRDLDDGEVTFAIKRCQKEDWSDELRACAMKAKTADEVGECTSRPGRPRRVEPPASAYASRSKQIEAELNLKRIEKLLRTHYMENALFPIGEVGPTPSASCCDGPSTKCANDASQWDDPVWRALDFELDEDTYYTYTYRSGSGLSAVAMATGDLDCDGIMSTFTLQCSAENGNPSCTLLKPDRGAD